MKLRYYKRSAVISVSCNESQVSEAKRVENCWTNYPTCEAKWDYINPAQLAAESVSKACFGVRPRDYGLKYSIFFDVKDLWIAGISAC
jgi:hypothetical protein